MTNPSDTQPLPETPNDSADGSSRREIIMGAAVVAAATAAVGDAAAQRTVGPVRPIAPLSSHTSELFNRLRPGLARFQPKVIGPADSEILSEWERLTTSRFGLSDRNAVVSKTIDSCPGGGFDLCDTD